MPDAAWNFETADATALGRAAICVLLNAGSGSAKGAEKQTQVSDAFARHGVMPEIRLIGNDDQLETEVRRAAQSGFDVIVAGGGDGTISCVAGHLAGGNAKMGVIPLGTFNFVARGLGIPEDVDAAVEALLSGAARPMTVGLVNGRIFLNNASLGIYPQILKEREGTYKRWGRSRIAAHWSVLVTFLAFRAPVRMKVIVDGQTRRRKTPLAFIARSAFQLEHFGLDGAGDVRDGQFALFLAPDSTRWQLLGRALRLAGKGMNPQHDFELICGEEIMIETSRATQLIAMDGERVRAQSPFRFRLLTDDLQVIAPEGAPN